MNWSRRVRKIGLLAVSGIAVTSFDSQIFGAGQGSVSTPSPITAYVRNAKFPIPFNLDATGALPSEVHLYVSRDNGGHWQLVARQHPTARNFDFDSIEEGTFWFATRTIDANGVAHPSGPMTPQLRITVDASRPQVEANADADGNGQVILDYNVLDASPADEGVRVEYMTDVAQSWVPLNNASQPTNQQWDAGLKGRLVWIPQGAWRFAWVRLFVRDRAGNETVVERRIERPRLAQNGIQLASNSVPTTPSPARFATQQSGAPTGNAAPTNAMPTNAMPTNVTPMNSLPMSSMPINAMTVATSQSNALPSPAAAFPQPSVPANSFAQPNPSLPTAPSLMSEPTASATVPLSGAYVPGQLPSTPSEPAINPPLNMFPPAMGSPAALNSSGRMKVALYRPRMRCAR